MIVKGIKVIKEERSTTLIVNAELRLAAKRDFTLEKQIPCKIV